MKAIAIAHKGLERFCQQEIKEILGIDGNLKDSVVEFEFEKYEQLFELCYLARSLIKVILLLSSGDINKITLQGYKSWIKETSRIKVHCKVLSNEIVFSQDLQQKISSEIVESLDFRPQVDLKNPDLVIYCLVVGQEYYFGIDFCGEDLSKRDYRIFNGATSVKGTIAFCTFKAAGETGEILDPICNTGTIAVEAALYLSRMSVHFFRKDKFLFTKLFDLDFDSFFSSIDKKAKIDGIKAYGYDSLLRNVKASQKNSQIAGINKAVFFSRVEQRWLDFKFTKSEIDAIVTHLPGTSRMVDEKALDKAYEEFFYQAEYIAKKSISVLTEKPNIAKEKALKYKLNLFEEITFPHGDRTLSILVFKREKV